MKTAISLPDKLFSAAEETAKKMGIPRSQLYAKAVEEFLEKHSQEQITSTINLILEEQNVALDPHLSEMQTASILQDDIHESW